MITMTSSNNITISRSLVRRMLIGAGIAFVIILLMVLGVDDPKPDWHKTWWIRPIVITPLAGAGGGFFFHFMFELGKEGTWKKIAVALIGIIGYVIALWMGIVLGLAGTLWN
jgi:hypothetical protein